MLNIKREPVSSTHFSLQTQSVETFFCEKGSKHFQQQPYFGQLFCDRSSPDICGRKNNPTFQQEQNLGKKKNLHETFYQNLSFVETWNSMHFAKFLPHFFNNWDYVITWIFHLRICLTLCATMCKVIFIFLKHRMQSFTLRQSANMDVKSRSYISNLVKKNRSLREIYCEFHISLKIHLKS